MNSVIALGAAAIATAGEILRIGEIAWREAVRRRAAGEPAGTPAADRGRAVLPADGQAGAAVEVAPVTSKAGRE